MKFHVPDMTCGHCTATLTKSLQAADASATLTPDLALREVTITSRLDAAAVIAVLQAAGYTASQR